MRLSLLLPFLFVTLASAQENLDRFLPKEPKPLAQEKAITPEPKPVVRPGAHPPGSVLKLRGLVFISSKLQLRTSGVAAMDGVSIENVPFINNPAFSQRMQKFVGQPLSLDLINLIGADVARYYKDHDHPVVSIVAPEQDVTNGTVQLLVTEAKLGQVHVAGNRWFSARIFKTRIKPGTPIIMSRLEADAAFYERNPFRTVSAELSPGTHSGETDITLRVKDKFPLRVFMGYENSGVKSTDENRFYAGFNWGNFLWLDQQFSYQFTTSPDFEQLTAHSATWTIPLPWRHLLQFSGTYSDSLPKMDEGFEMKGQSWQVSAHYIAPLPGTKRFSHELNLGYDFKFTDNNLQFGGEQVFETPVEISQFSLAYNASLKDSWGSTGLALIGYWSPGNMSSHNDDEDFDAARQDSTADYFYGSLGLDRLTKLPLGLTWSVSARGQLANRNLQATEQFLLGGQSTVRGYDELVVAGDQGVLVRNEIYAPAFSVGKVFGMKTAQDQLQFLVFYDYGYAEVKQPLEGEDKSTELQSVGVGVRWQFKDNLSARFDYGWQLQDIGLEDHSRAHIGVTLSF